VAGSSRARTALGGRTHLRLAAHKERFVASGASLSGNLAPPSIRPGEVKSAFRMPSLKCVVTKCSVRQKVAP
jgi:hypothetical protein